MFQEKITDSRELKPSNLKYLQVDMSRHNKLREGELKQWSAKPITILKIKLICVRSRKYQNCSLQIKLQGGLIDMMKKIKT